MSQTPSQPERSPSKVAIIGAGQGGTTLLEIFAKEPYVKVVGIADVSPAAPGMRLARELGIPTTTDFRELLRIGDLDVIINVTNNPVLAQALQDERPPHTEVMSGLSALLMWQLIEARRRAKEESDRMLNEYQALFDLGVKQTSAAHPDQLFDLIVEYATQLVKTPAGSLAVYDEATGVLRLAAAKGFSPAFMAHSRWGVRPGGLTSRVLSQGAPLVIPDVSQAPYVDNPVLLREKVRALMAIPLSVERRIVGILYVNDFKVREFTQREASVLSLLSTLAAMSIHRLLLIEQDRFMDELTALFNYRFFMRQLGLEMERVKRRHGTLCLLMMDLDHFKRYNDTHGHQKGSELLRDVALCLKQACRQEDLVARYGGEEFAVIMPEADGPHGLILAERVRRAVEEHRFEGAETLPAGRLTVSIGAAAAPIDAKSADDLIQRADTALYRAKQAGRNRSFLYSSGSGPAPSAQEGGQDRT